MSPGILRVRATTSARPAGHVVGRSDECPGAIPTVASLENNPRVCHAPCRGVPVLTWSVAELTLICAVVFLFGGVPLWLTWRARRLRAALAARDAAALAAVEAQRAAQPQRSGQETVLAGMPTRMIVRGGIEVRDVTEVVDIDALLAGESPQVAGRARASLEEPTNIHTGLEDDVELAHPVITPLPSSSAARSTVTVTGPTTQGLQRSTVGPSTSNGGSRDVALRELVLAWSEARGYRQAPASPVVRPIELVLRHRADPARAYGFVVDKERLSAERAAQLRMQAKSIGLRLMLVAEAGASGAALNYLRNTSVRLMDRAAIDSELGKLDLSVAAKIIAVARRRSARLAA